MTDPISAAEFVRQKDAEWKRKETCVDIDASRLGGLSPLRAAAVPPHRHQRIPSASHRAFSINRVKEKTNGYYSFRRSSRRTRRVLAATHGRPGRLDLPGAATVTAGMTLLVYGLSRAASSGWTNTLTGGSLVAAVVLLASFIIIELRSKQPLLPLGIFANRNRSGAYAVRLAIGATLSGMLFFLTEFMQNILGYSPLKAGLAFLPITVGVVLGAQAASRLIGRIGPRPLMSLGGLVGAVGLFGLSRVTEHSSYASGVLGPVLALSFGLGLIFVSTTIVAVAGVSPRESGLSSALLNVGQQLGGSLGIAILGTIAATVTSNQLAIRIPTHALSNQAFTAGYRSAFAISAGIARVGFVVAIAVIKGRPQHAEVAGVPEAA